MPKIKFLIHAKLSIIVLSFFTSFSILGQDAIYLTRDQNGIEVLNTNGAEFFASLALACIQQEYPNKLNQQLVDEKLIQNPKALHPAFYGCYDWHSSVHGHWMLIHLLKKYPNMPSTSTIIEKIDQNLSSENIQVELNYILQESKSWERMYGWAWLLKLGEELYTWDNEYGHKWYNNLKPLLNYFIEQYGEFLAVQKYPVRTGVHPNTAFGLSLAYDFAVTTKSEEFEWLIRKTALKYYLNDENCPVSWEPSGEDFLSPCLEEANLMRRVLDSKSFNKWFDDFIDKKELKTILIPADVADRSDPKIVHLDGLNLSRATCLFGISKIIESEKAAKMLNDAANNHLSKTLPNVASENYEGTHWLGTFAVFALSSK